MRVDLDPVTRMTPKSKSKPPAIYEAGGRPIRLSVGGKDVEIKERHGMLEIRTIEGSLVVRPHTSNVVLLEVEEWS